MSIEISHVSRRYGDFAALDDVSLSVAKGELIALLGPSGSGKTTLLRIVAGLDWPDGGDVLLDGKSVLDHGAAERGVGFVFQHYALFRHMSVFDNVAFGLRVRPSATRPSKAEIADRVMKLLKLVQIDWLADRSVTQLSGGQRQRVALARALAIEPEVLMLDEPFGALDAKVRKDLRRWLRRLHDEMGMTTVFVTHDQEEALELADRVVVMGQGHIEQIGSPHEIYANPANPFVFEFLGSVNKLPCNVAKGDVGIEGLVVDSAIRMPEFDGRGTAYVRPHDIELTSAHGGGTVRLIAASGPIVKMDVELDKTGQVIEVDLPLHRYNPATLTAGTSVGLVVRRLKVFPEAEAEAAAKAVAQATGAEVSLPSP
ncbi:MAG TPA: sulfate ABC transporter ATP-binding protein [Alphaproteobacteria bacterium]|jgi:sulfate transport system ATP-binding protein